LGADRPGVPKYGKVRSVTVETDKSAAEIIEEIAELFGAEIRNVGRPRKEEE